MHADAPSTIAKDIYQDGQRAAVFIRKTQMDSKPWTKPGLSADERARLYQDHVWTNRMRNVFGLADPAAWSADMEDEHRELLDAHARDATPKWTPVAEGLPPLIDGKCKRCLIAGLSRGWDEPLIGQYIDGEWWTDGSRSFTVTHWMPLPAPPHEVSRG